MKEIKTRQVLHLEQLDVQALLVEALLARGFATTGGVQVRFVRHADDTVGVLVENMRAPESADGVRSHGPVEERPPRGRGGRRFKPKISDARVQQVVQQVLGRRGGSVAEHYLVERVVEVLGDGGEFPVAMDFEQQVATMKPRVRKTLEEFQARGQVEGNGLYWRVPLASSEPRSPEQSESDAAADVLGGEGGAMGRGEGLETAYRDPMLDMDGVGGWDNEPG